MKVLYILHTTYWDGSAHSLLNMIHSVKKEVTPIVVFREKNIVYDFYKKEGIKCIVVPFINNIKKTSGEKKLKLILKILRYIFFNFLSIIYLFFKLKNENIEIIHSNSGIVTIGYPLAKILHAKHVIHIREFQDIDFGISPLMGWKLFYKRLAHTDARIAITKAVYNHFNLNNYSNSYQLFNAVLSQENAIYIQQKENYFVFCCAVLSEAKGVDFCLEAFGRSGLYKKGYYLDIIGKNADAELYEKLFSIIKKYEMIEYVRFIGTVKDIKPYLEKATGFLMCSQNEGFGRVTAEAMFYGCPVIARNSGGSPEFITNKKNGFLFNDIDECVEHMKTIVKSDMSNIIQYAQELAVKQFSEEAYKEKILEIYNKIL